MTDSIIPSQDLKKDLPPQNVEETLAVGQDLSRQAKDEVTGDLEIAAHLAEKAGESSGPVIQDISGLRQEIDEASAAFEARIKRLQSPYVLSPELAKVQEVAEILEKPLLLEGEPGTGKTSLPYALAAHKDLPIIHAQCTSTTTAEKLLYSIDDVGRFRDAQAGKDVADLSKYVRFGPLGKAFSSQEKVILLIDEVDKAKREFTNDLLHELDQMSFFIPETGQEVSARLRPIVIITSNHEKDLPEPVLRRCVYEFIEFPTPEQMTEIVKAHIPDVNESLLEQATETFYRLRETNNLEKKPSTSEMLDWVKVLMKFGVTEITDDKEVPFLNTLIKSKEDLDLLKEVINVENEGDENRSEDKYLNLVRDIQNGRRVIVLDVDNPINLHLVLANNGFVFNDGYESVELQGKGMANLMNDTISIAQDSEEGNRLIDVLGENGLITSEYITSNGDHKFVEVESSNFNYVRGKDENGRSMFRTSDGEYIVQAKFEPESNKIVEVKDTNVPFNNLPLGEKYLGALHNAGLRTVKDIVLLINGGVGVFHEKTGLGMKSVVDIKKVLRDEGYAFIGESEYSKPSRSKVVDEDSQLGEVELAETQSKGEV